MLEFSFKMQQIQFRLGSAPEPAGELSALPAGFEKGKRRGGEGNTKGTLVEK